MIEALTIKSEVRSEFAKYLYSFLEEEMLNRNLASEAILSSKLRRMTELGRTVNVDNGYLENCEYQLFIDSQNSNRTLSTRSLDRNRISQR